MLEELLGLYGRPAPGSASTGPASSDAALLASGTGVQADCTKDALAVALDGMRARHAGLGLRCYALRN